MPKRPRSPASSPALPPSPPLDFFRSTPQTPWIRLPEDSITPPPPPPYQSLRSKLKSIRQKRNPQPPSPLATTTQPPLPTSSPHENLTQILHSLSSDFTGQNRPYVALAASSAASLIQQGRQDDINAGLWQFVVKKETEMLRHMDENGNNRQE